MRIDLAELVTLALPDVTNAAAAAPQEPATHGMGRSAARAPALPRTAATKAATVAVRAGAACSRSRRIMLHQLDRTTKCRRESPARVRLPSQMGRAHWSVPDT